MDKAVLEGYNLRVLRKFLRIHLPWAGKNGGPHSYGEWYRLTLFAPKYEIVPLIEAFSIPIESMIAELDELQQKDILRGLKSTRRGGGRLTGARKRSHQKYHHEVVSPRRKATRHYMMDHPELVDEIKRKHELA